jgi:uncharacterized protein (DUF433 family)
MFGVVTRGIFEQFARSNRRRQMANEQGWAYNQAGSMDYREIITIEPDKMGGKPCIRGLRITVYDVLDYLASGMAEAEILADFPDLIVGDIRACLVFASDRERGFVSDSKI